MRVAVAGCGYWGPNLVRNFISLRGCELAAVCDTDGERLAEMERRFGSLRMLTDFEDVLADDTIDGVAICTPVHTHHPLAKAALEAGKHVLLTKPMTHSVATALELVELAAERGLTLQVDHTYVYSPAVQALRRIIDRGQVGDILYFDSVRVNLGLFQCDTNVIWDLAPHDVSIMNYLIDETPRWVSAVGSAHYGEFEDVAYITVRFDGALIAHFHVNWLAPVKLRSTLIGCDKKMIVYDDLAPSEKVRVYDKGVTRRSSREDRAQALVDYRVGDMHAPHIDHGEPLASVVADFQQAIETGSRTRCDGTAGLRVVQVLEAAQQSLKNQGEPVRLPAPVSSATSPAAVPATS